MTTWMPTSDRYWTCLNPKCQEEFLTLVFLLWTLSRFPILTFLLSSKYVCTVYFVLSSTDREDIVKVTIEIDNLVITNLATFETKIAHLDIEDLSLELELTLADLRMRLSKNI